MKTKTYPSTSSFGKKKFEAVHLIPTLREMLMGVQTHYSIGLLGTHHGVERHVLNMEAIGIPRERQVYVEQDEQQYKDTKSTADEYGVDYRFGDIVEQSISLHQRISIQDIDACGVVSDINFRWIDGLDNPNNDVDIQIQVINLHNGQSPFINSLCEIYGIDTTLSHALKVGLVFQKYCKTKGFNCAWRIYKGAGSVEGKCGGNPMMCVIISKLPIPVQFHMLADYKLVYNVSKNCRMRSGKLNKSKLARECRHIVGRLTVPKYIKNYEQLTLPQNHV